MAAKTQIKRIALLISQDVSFFRDVIRGIREYAQPKPWALRDGAPTWETVKCCRQWNPHGIIAHLALQGVADKVLALGKPVVDIAYSFPKLGVPVVDVDHKAVGIMAAEHFLKRGFRHFGFFGSSEAWYSQLRETAYCEHLASYGKTVIPCYADYRRYPPTRDSWQAADQRIRKWLKQLPKPIGILAVDDAPARSLADMCRLSGLCVPDDIALLGVDNDEMECHFAIPPLSSVAIPGQQIGYEAARLLDRMMRGERPPSLFLPPVGVVVRQSSDVFAVEDNDVAAALAFIRKHMAEKLTVGMVVYEVGVARRTLENKFRAILNRSILDEIHRFRVETAKQLLIETDLPMAAIARRTGFASAERLATVFGQIVGMAPTNFRRQTKIQPAGS